MDVEEKAEQLTAHIVDPKERERRKKNLIRALKVVETPPEEPLAEDDGQIDGVPVARLADLNSRESGRLAVLKSQRAIIFELEDEPVKVETPIDLLNKRGKYGYTPLMQAVVDKDLGLITQLLAKGADPSIKDNGGMTALEKAKRANDKQIVSLLEKYE